MDEYVTGRFYLVAVLSQDSEPRYSQPYKIRKAAVNVAAAILREENETVVVLDCNPVYEIRPIKPEVA